MFLISASLLLVLLAAAGDDQMPADFLKRPRRNNLSKSYFRGDSV